MRHARIQSIRGDAVSVAPYMSLFAPGTANPPSGGGGGGGGGFNLHEAFDEADLTALIAKYDPNIYVSDPAFVSVTSGYLELLGDASRSIGSPHFVEIFPPAFSLGAASFWMRVQLAMIGGAYDATSTPFQSFIYTGSPTFGCEIDLDGFGGMTGEEWEEYLYVDGTNPQSAVSKNFAAGSHTIIQCASEIDATNFSGELWIDPSTGDPPDATGTSTKPSGDTFAVADITFFGPHDSARSIRFLDIEIVAAARSADPFGIL